jgi:hypothetical protein
MILSLFYIMYIYTFVLPIFQKVINDKNHKGMIKCNILLILNTVKMPLLTNLYSKDICSSELLHEYRTSTEFAVMSYYMSAI